MGRDNKKTNSAQSSRDKDESEIEEREGAVSNSEVTAQDSGYETDATSDGEPIDGTKEVAAVAAAEEPPSWGFEEKKSRFSREVLIAFVAIVVLVGLFGIIVWKQFSKPGKAPSEADVAAAGDTQNDPFKEPPAQEPMQPMQPMSQVADNGASPMAEVPMQTEPVVDPFNNSNEKATDLFADNNNRPTGLLDRRTEPMNSEPMSSEPVGNDPLATDPVFNEPAPMNNVAGRPLKATTSTEITVNDEPPPQTRATQAQEESFDDLPNRKAIQPSINTNEFRVDETLEQPMRRGPQPEPSTFEPMEEPFERRPVAVTNVVPEEPRTLDPVPMNPEFYVVQEGDNFWEISKKVYGTHGLFLALYEFNRQTIPNADLLKPGMKLQTPDCNTLKSLAVKVTQGLPERPIGRVVSTEPKSGITRVARNEPRPAGIYETEKGLKVYRIGEGDTLIKIATQHLGRADRWKQIYNMNRDQLKSEQDLHIGKELRLPADASPTPLLGTIASGRTIENR